MSDMSKRKELPWYINDITIVKEFDDNIGYVYPSGRIKLKKNTPTQTLADFGKVLSLSDDKLSDVYYYDLEGDNLTVNQIGVENGKFYAVEVSRITYNPIYNEIFITPDVEAPMIYNVCKSGKKACIVFLQRILALQSWYPLYYNYKDLEEVRDGNMDAFMKAFFFKAHKYLIPNILESDNPYTISFIKDIIEDKVDYANSKKINLKSIINFSKTYNIDLRFLIILFEKYSHTELEKFAKLMAHFGHNCNNIFDILCSAEIPNFTKFANYFIKQGLTTNEFHLEEKNKETDKYLQLYMDYLNCCQYLDDYDLYPNNLKLAHDSALDLVQVELNGKKYNTVKFKNAVDSYRHYEWRYGEYKVEVPKTILDVNNEGYVMGNCVALYIDGIISGRSKICFMRMNEKPYLTIEVRHNSVVQVKGKENSDIDSQQRHMLNIWASSKGLSVSA